MDDDLKTLALFLWVTLSIPEKMLMLTDSWEYYFKLLFSILLEACLITKYFSIYVCKNNLKLLTTTQTFNKTFVKRYCYEKHIVKLQFIWEKDGKTLWHLKRKSAEKLNCKSNFKFFNSIFYSTAINYLFIYSINVLSGPFIGVGLGDPNN